MNRIKKYYLVGATFMAMFIMAISDSTRGLLIPTFKSEFYVSDTTIGIFLFICSLAYVTGTYVGSILCSRFGQKRIIQLGMAIAGVSFLITSYGQSFFQLMIGYGVVTVGIAFIVMGMNTILPLVKLAYVGVVMNMLHFFYGFGATITQKVTGYLLVNGITWRMIFMAYFAFYVFAFIVYSFVSQPGSRDDDRDKKGKSKIENKTLVILFSVALGFYITSEIQTSNWMMNYLKEVYAFNTDQGSYYIAMFFGLLSVGRLVGGFVIDKFGYVRSLILSQIIGFCFYFTGLTIGIKGLILISIAGFFFSISYPTVILLVQRIFKKNGTRIVGIVTMTASSISMVAGYIIGYLNDIIGPDKTFYLIPLSLVVSIVLLFVIAQKIRVLNDGELV